jgi:hypothetical protein
MQIPGLGEVTKDERFGCHFSQPIRLAVLGGIECRVGVEGYDEDPNKEDYHIAVTNFFSCPPSVLKEVESQIFQYYLDTRSRWPQSDHKLVNVNLPSEIWNHIQLGNEPMVCRRACGDRKIYISVECNCDWEPEHGLQIVFRDGVKVCKIGPYDGHLTNSDAFADQRLENVIYRSAV